MHCTDLSHKRRRRRKNNRCNGTRVSTGQRQHGNTSSTANHITIQDSLTTDITLTPVRELTSDTLQSDLEQNSLISPSLFPSLQHTVQQSENHYEISNTNSNPYHYAIGSGVSTFNITNRHHEMQEDMNRDLTGNAYEEADLSTAQTDSVQTREIMSMLNRPLPHRPISVGVREGPSLPPRERHGIRPFTTSSTSRLNESLNNSQIGGCSTDYNSITDEIQPDSLDIIKSTPITHHDDSRDEDEHNISKTGENTQHVVDVYPYPGATSRASANHGYYSADDLQRGEGNNVMGAIPLFLSKPDPFYHCLENEHQQMCSGGDGLLQSESNDHGDRDVCQAGVMVDNILYNPLPFTPITPN